MANAKRKIILHIGHGKTGSSAIQAALARNHHLLKAEGLLYPENPDSDRARLGQVTSGNVTLQNWFEGHVIPIARAEADYDRILFSNENIFHHFDTFLDSHRKYADEFDFEIILFVREPFEKLNSAYQQLVKRSGFSGDIAECAAHDNDPARAATLLQALEAQDVAFKLFNYSALRRDAVPAVFQYLGVWDRIAAEGHADVGTVNRSLTPAELEFLLHVNRVFGRQLGSTVANALVERLPDLPSGQVRIDAATRKSFHDRHRSAVDTINNFLPAFDQLTLELGKGFSQDGPAATRLSDAQVAVIQSVFPNVLTYADGIVLRDIAMKYESGEALTRDDAIALMQYAQKARPHGQIIAGKLREWREA